jgi:hypothetical protein
MNLGESGKPVIYLYATDRERALGFYRDMFGLGVCDSDPFGDFLKLHNALLRLTVIPDHQPGQHPVFGWDVEDIVGSVTELRGRGVDFMVFDPSSQDDLGIWTAPDGGKLAFFADPDGNVLTLSQA